MNITPADITRVAKKATGLRWTTQRLGREGFFTRPVLGGSHPALNAACDALRAVEGLDADVVASEGTFFIHVKPTPATSEVIGDEIDAACDYCKGEGLELTAGGPSPLPCPTCGAVNADRPARDDDYTPEAMDRAAETAELEEHLVGLLRAITAEAPRGGEVSRNVLRKMAADGYPAHVRIAVGDLIRIAATWASDPEMVRALRP